MVEETSLYWAVERTNRAIRQTEWAEEVMSAEDPFEGIDTLAEIRQCVEDLRAAADAWDAVTA